jgi:protein TonB
MHTVAIVAIVGASVASIRLPNRAPRELPRFVMTPVVELPRPLGRPDVLRAAAQPRPAPAVRTTAPRVPTQPSLTAPAQVPDAIPQVMPAGDGATTSTTPGTGAAGWGDPLGDPNAIDAGQTAVADTPDTIYSAGGEVRSASVRSRVAPEYPPVMLAARREGWVRVQCVIDRLGHARDVTIVASSFPAFEAPAVRALERWTFTPGTLRGTPVDTYFELTVRFTLR